ncbi:ABC transporter permease subunit [Flammeovirga yaeyamensis]|uniref:ABC transporter permease subunit n=1 Tax=Flammeovirga yaeyamensis TaxID=367791 RepID=A0AAX1NB39_9BACT|nr:MULTISPECIES: ABC transporter permease subunit [Flammeovirga]ANQ49264.1 ABC transporter permease subunit [Flammeovirga sp. MY04]MBB3697874.1 nitrate/nitrite transport system permease protein [Flammeovirga yaeyamensis]NMF35771.1 ABC transporter permease subunit [Flammeovirga yaeyamensis]QWG03277.1 ABC transporter permease subunit [Flammeovirga yaeyamensis]
MKEKILQLTGIQAFLAPWMNIFKGEETKKNVNILLRSYIFPLLSILLFILVWHSGATYLYNKEATAKIEKARTERGEAAALEMQNCIFSGDVSCQPNTLPSPAKVWDAYLSLLADHRIISGKKEAFEKKVAKTNAKRVAEGKAAITYTGRPSFVDQIGTSLKTVFAGFLLAALIAIPIGIIIGLSPTLRTSMNWLIQILKPVSPVVWLLLVFMIVKTLMSDSDMDKSFMISFISVGLCSMWATLVNTSMGVSTVDKDFVNVARVLKLSIGQNIFKVVLPSSLPMIFTGLRITLSVAWMVLIAIELLAQSPGLGSFVWEEFQNGANDSNAKIIVAMFVIGLIGFMLDRIMMVIQKMMSFNKEVA